VAPNKLRKLAGRQRGYYPAGTQTFSYNVYDAFRIGSECPFIERLVLVKTFS